MTALSEPSLAIRVSGWGITAYFPLIYPISFLLPWQKDKDHIDNASIREEYRGWQAQHQEEGFLVDDILYIANHT